VGDRQNNRIQIFDQDGQFIAEWKQFGRPSGIFIDKNDVLYVGDSESRDGEPRLRLQPRLPPRHSHRQRERRLSEYFLPDSTPYPYSPSAVSTSSEGVTADARGNIYGAEFTMDVKKYALK